MSETSLRLETRSLFPGFQRTACVESPDNQLLCTKNFGACEGSTAEEKVQIQLYYAKRGNCEFLILSIDILQFDCLIRFDTACDIFMCFVSTFPFTNEL